MNTDDYDAYWAYRDSHPWEFRRRYTEAEIQRELTIAKWAWVVSVIGWTVALLATIGGAIFG